MALPAAPLLTSWSGILASSPSILLAEDEVLIAIHLQSVLEDAGFEVLVASSGKEALAILNGSEPQPSGIVTDINLGEGPDGWDVARRARELSSLTQVVYMSGAASMDYCSRGVPLSLMIEKPFADAQLVTAISGQLNTTTL